MDNNLNHWAKGSSQDLRISIEDCLEIVDCLHDERLSRAGVFKFKNLNEINSISVPSIGLFCLPIGYGLAKFFTGRTNRSQSGYRYLFTVMSITYPLACWYGYTRPIPRRIHTEIICDYGEDGTYVRQRISQVKPGLWRKLSHQLHGLGYTFPEILQSQNQLQFPKDFVQ